MKRYILHKAIQIEYMVVGLWSFSHQGSCRSPLAAFSLPAISISEGKLSVACQL